MKPREIEQFADNHAEELAAPQMNYQMRSAWMAHVIWEQGIVATVQDALLYGGYIAAAYERTAPAKPDVDAILANLI